VTNIEVDRCLANLEKRVDDLSDPRSPVAEFRTFRYPRRTLDDVREARRRVKAGGDCKEVLEWLAMRMPGTPASPKDFVALLLRVHGGWTSERWNEKTVQEFAP